MQQNLFSESVTPIVFQPLPLDEASQRLHDRAVERAKNYLACEALLLESIIEVDQSRLYEKLGVNSTFHYCVEILRLSRDVALNFISVARLSRKVPEVKAAVDSGEICLSSARKMAAVITPENHKDWITMAKTLPKAALEKEVAKASPKSAQDRACYINEDQVKLEIVVSEKVMKDLRRAQDLESQRNAKSVSLQETLDAALEYYLERKDPLRKAARAQARTRARANANASARTESPVDARVKEPTNARAMAGNQSWDVRGIPAHIRHAVNQRDQGQCQARMANDEKCGSTRWVDFHHIKPRSEGGADTVENLTTLCRACHRLWHRRPIKNE